MPVILREACAHVADAKYVLAPRVGGSISKEYESHAVIVVLRHVPANRPALRGVFGVPGHDHRTLSRIGFVDVRVRETLVEVVNGFNLYLIAF